MAASNFNSNKPPVLVITNSKERFERHSAEFQFDNSKYVHMGLPFNNFRARLKGKTFCRVVIDEELRSAFADMGGDFKMALKNTMRGTAHASGISYDYLFVYRDLSKVKEKVEQAAP